MMTRSTLLCALTLLVACREPAADPQTGAEAATASAPVFERSAGAPEAAEAPSKAKSEAAGSGEAGPEAEADPAAEADAASEVDPDEGDAETEAEAAAETASEAGGELPGVEVRNVGMHIGGEKNTAAQKQPIRSVVQGHYDAMKRCWGKASEPPQKAIFGIDMRIPGEGGKVSVQKPRSGLEGEAKQCLVDLFASIEFPRQPGGRPRMVSFSVEFTKK